MRNLKKFLALVLAMMMVFSLMLTASAAKLSDYADSNTVDSKYQVAVDVLSQLGVFKGTGSSFEPKKVLTRAEVATLVYRVITGDVTDAQSSIYTTYGKFTDVTVEDYPWAIGAINFAANGEYVYGGGDNMFYPSYDITGYQLLAIMLRALGYGRNEEFQGNGWEVRTADAAARLGITKNITGIDLGKGITREVVAQIIYNALDAELVEYSIGLGYQKQVGKHLIHLYVDREDVNDWGVPSTFYYAVWEKVPGHEGYASITYPMVADFNVAMSDCDIYDNDEFDVDEGNIVAWYDDGNKMDPADLEADTFIDDLDVTDYIGGQGVWTRIYRVGYNYLGQPNYHVVTIHTWLAKVTGVNAPYRDKNGHMTQRTIDLDIYTAYNGSDVDNRAVETTATVANEDKVVGDYVLVYINKPVYNTTPTSTAALSSKKSVTIVGTPTVLANGQVTSFTKVAGDKPAYTYLGTTPLAENTQNFLNQHVFNTNWVALGDQYGNLIGLASVADNYVILEAITWRPFTTGSATAVDGYAIADLIFADGSTQKGVTIAKIDASGDGIAKVPQNFNAAAGDLTAPIGDADDGKIADNYARNAAYYGHLYSYVEEDGQYTLYLHGTVPNIVDVAGNGSSTGATLTKGSAEIKDASGAVKAIANDYTVFMIKQANGLYKKYVGKDEVPNRVFETLCILNNSEGYAALVIAEGGKDPAGSGSYMVAYVGDKQTTAATQNSTGKFGYLVYPIGQQGTAIIYDGASHWASMKTGLYEFHFDANGLIDAAPKLLADDSEKNTVGPTTPDNAGASTKRYATVVATAAGQGTSIYASPWSTGATFDVAVGSGTSVGYVTTRSTLKVFEVYKNSNTANDYVVYMNPVTVTDIKAGNLLVIEYQAVGGVNYADTIYIIKLNPSGSTTGGNTYNPLVDLVMANVGTSLTLDYTNNTGAAQTNVQLVIEYRTIGATVWSTFVAGSPEASLADQAAATQVTGTAPTEGGAQTGFEFRGKLIVDGTTIGYSDTVTVY